MADSIGTEIEKLYSTADVQQLTNYETAYQNALNYYNQKKDLQNQAQLQGASYNWSNQDKNDAYNAAEAVANAAYAQLQLAKVNLEDYREYLFQKYLLVYQSLHPEQTVQIAQVQAEAQAQQTIAQAQATALGKAAEVEAAQKAADIAAASKRKTIIVLAVVGVVLVIGGIWAYKKFIKK